MKEQEKGFFDSLIDDFAATAEMQAAIEASRDENGKIDAAKAAGISMGLGHTSDNDIAMMGALLGAQGAFDDDDAPDGDITIQTPDSFSMQSFTPTAQSEQHTLSAAEYDRKKKSILAEKRFIITMCVLSIFLFSFSLLYCASESESGGRVFLLTMAVVDASLIYGIHNTNQARERSIAKVF